MANKLRVGVVGCGQIAQIAHLPYLQELPMFEIGAICDFSPKVLSELGSKYRLNEDQCYLDYNDLVKREDLDVVLVTNKDHGPVILAALEAGKHVMTEKPMTLNLGEADDVIRSAKANKRTVMVGYMKRYDPAYQYALDVIKGMGKIHMIRMHDFAGSYTINPEIYSLAVGDDLSKAELDAATAEFHRKLLVDIGEERRPHLELYDILMHLCVHDINVLQGAFGIPKIHSAWAYDDTFVNALLEYPDGKKVVWESGNLVTLMDWDEQLWVFGRDQRVEVRFPFPYLKNAATVVNINSNEGRASVDRRVVVSFDEAFKREWIHFYECVTNGREPMTNPAEARRDIEFLAELMCKVT